MFRCCVLTKPTVLNPQHRSHRFHNSLGFRQPKTNSPSLYKLGEFSFTSHFSVNAVAQRSVGNWQL